MLQNAGMAHISTQASPQYSIRPADEADQEGILNCLAAAFEPYRKDYTAGAFADTVLDRTTLGERLRGMHVLVATSESATSESETSETKIIGTVAGAVSGDQRHLRGMAVLPELRGAGVAGQLLSAIEAWLREQGCSQVTLDTTPPLKAAMRFYEKNGYIPSGRTRDFFGMTLVEYVKAL
jgi:GNAT superfamily N-acetyltransferase